jgi:hypothetical protein
LRLAGKGEVSEDVGSKKASGPLEANFTPLLAFSVHLIFERTHMYFEILTPPVARLKNQLLKEGFERDPF